MSNFRVIYNLGDIPRVKEAIESSDREESRKIMLSIVSNRVNAIENKIKITEYQSFQKELVKEFFDRGLLPRGPRD